MTKKCKLQKAYRLGEISANIRLHFFRSTSYEPITINQRIREVQEAKQLLIDIENELINSQFPNSKI